MPILTCPLFGQLCPYYVLVIRHLQIYYTVPHVPIVPTVISPSINHFLNWCYTTFARLLPTLSSPSTCAHSPVTHPLPIEHYVSTRYPLISHHVPIGLCSILCMPIFNLHFAIHVPTPLYQQQQPKTIIPLKMQWNAQCLLSVACILHSIQNQIDLPSCRLLAV